MASATPDLAATPLPDPAPAPETLAAASLDGGLRIGWSDPQDATIGGWYFRHRAGNGSFGAWAEIASVAADPEDASRLVFDTTDESGVALANGTAHTVEIRATRTKYYDDDNQLQPMPETKLVNGLKVVRSPVLGLAGRVTGTPSATPAKPTGLTATPGPESVTLTWTGPADPTIVRWELRQRADNGQFDADDEWTAIADSDADTREHEIADLVAGNPYRFAVRAVSRNADQPLGAPAVLVARPLSLPAKITNFRASRQQNHNAASLSWTEDPAAAITSREYRHKPAFSGDWSEWETFVGETVSGNTVHGSVPDLRQGVAYEIQVRAVNVVGAGEASDKVTVTLYEPAKLAGVKAVAAGSRSATLSWIPSADPSVTGYAYQRKSVAWFPPQRVSGRQTASIKYTSLSNNVAYTFRVWALHPRSPWNHAKNRPGAPPVGDFAPEIVGAGDTTGCDAAEAADAGEADRSCGRAGWRRHDHVVLDLYPGPEQLGGEPLAAQRG